MSVWNLAKYVAEHQPEYIDFEIIEEVSTYNDKMYSILYTEEKKTLFGRIKQEQVYLSIMKPDSLIARRFFSIDEAKKKVSEIINEYKVHVPKTVLYCRQFVNDNDIAESVNDSKPENSIPQTEHKNDKDSLFIRPVEYQLQHDKIITITEDNINTIAGTSIFGGKPIVGDKMMFIKLATFNFSVDSFPEVNTSINTIYTHELKDFNEKYVWDESIHSYKLK